MPSLADFFNQLRTAGAPPIPAQQDRTQEPDFTGFTGGPQADTRPVQLRGIREPYSVGAGIEDASTAQAYQPLPQIPEAALGSYRTQVQSYNEIPEQALQSYRTRADSIEQLQRDAGINELSELGEFNAIGSANPYQPPGAGRSSVDDLFNPTQLESFETGGVDALKAGFIPRQRIPYRNQALDSITSVTGPAGKAIGQGLDVATDALSTVPGAQAVVGGVQAFRDLTGVSAEEAGQFIGEQGTEAFIPEYWWELPLELTALGIAGDIADARRILRNLDAANPQIRESVIRAWETIRTRAAPEIKRLTLEEAGSIRVPGRGDGTGGVTRSQLGGRPAIRQSAPLSEEADDFFSDPNLRIDPVAAGLPDVVEPAAKLTNNKRGIRDAQLEARRLFENETPAKAFDEIGRYIEETPKNSAYEKGFLEEMERIQLRLWELEDGNVVIRPDVILPTPPPRVDPATRDLTEGFRGEQGGIQRGLPGAETATPGARGYQGGLGETPVVPQTGEELTSLLARSIGEEAPAPPARAADGGAAAVRIPDEGAGTRPPAAPPPETRPPAALTERYSDESIAELKKRLKEDVTAARAGLPSPNRLPGELRAPNRTIRMQVEGLAKKPPLTALALYKRDPDFVQRGTLLGAMDELVQKFGGAMPKKRLNKEQLALRLQRILKTSGAGVDDAALEAHLKAEGFPSKQEMAQAFGKSRARGARDKKRADAKFRADEQRRLNREETKAAEQQARDFDRGLKRVQVQQERELKASIRAAEKADADTKKGAEALQRRLDREETQAFKENMKDYDDYLKGKAKIRRKMDFEEVRASLQEGRDFDAGARERAKQRHKLDMEEQKFALEQMKDWTSPTGVKWRDEIGALLGLARTAKTALDFSAPGRQGLKLAFTHPMEWLHAWKPMFDAAWSDADAQAIRAELDEMLAVWKERFPNMPMVNLYEIGSDASHLERVPGFETSGGNIGRWTRKVPGFAQSERAYATFLNYQKAHTFHKMAQAMWDTGLRDQTQFKNISDVIDHATGYGAAPLKGAVEAQALFSQRFTTSLIQFFTDPLYFALVKGDMRAARFAANNLVRFTGGMATIGWMGSEMGVWDYEVDPRSSNFGKLRIGPQRIDFGAGALPLIRTAARVATGTGKAATGGSYSVTEGKEVLKFFRNKLAPIPSAGITQFTGENPIGEEAPNILSLEMARDLFLPLIADAVLEAFNESPDPKHGFIAAFSEAFGGGSSVYGTGQVAQIEAAREQGVEYDDLRAKGQAEINAQIIDSGQPLEWREHQGAWWTAREDALERWQFDLSANDPEVANHPITLAALSAEDIGSSADMTEYLELWVRENYDMSREDAAEVARKFISKTRLNDYVKAYRAEVIQADPHFMDAWSEAYNAGETDIEPYAWAEDYAAELAR